MKLKKKRTGEIGELVGGTGLAFIVRVFAVRSGDTPFVDYQYNSIAELCEEWTDYEDPKEPKEFWHISCEGKINRVPYNEHCCYQEREIGNWFYSREEAEEAVRKLQAWKRLKDKGFRFIDWETDDRTVADGKVWFDLGGREMNCDEALRIQEIKDSMQLLFGGEE